MSKANQAQAGSPSQSSRILAQRLKLWRHEQGVPLRVLAGRLDVSISTVSAWENGTRFPSATHLDSLSACLGLPVCGLLYGGKGPCPFCGREAPSVGKVSLN